MKKHPIGFIGIIDREGKNEKSIIRTQHKPKRSVVQVKFPERGMTLAYYNDKFDLKVGDLVYVEGKLEGMRGQVVSVNYSFKIRLSDYMKVIAVVDTDVRGELYFAGTHIVSFERDAMPFEKAVTWFKAPQPDEEYVVGEYDGSSFILDDLSGMGVSGTIANRGHDYYMSGNVCYISIEDTKGHAIVEGSELYEVDFDYIDGEISNITCSCFCSYPCKHQFAAMLQLKETLDFIAENYNKEYKGFFAAVRKDIFFSTAVAKKEKGRLKLEM